MIVETVLVLAAIAIGVGLALILKRMVELHVELKTIHARIKKIENEVLQKEEQPKWQTDFAVDDPFVNEKGLYSYDAYETKMKLKYDRPKNVVEV